MIWIIFSYLFAVFFILNICQKFRLKTEEIKNLTLKKNGLNFFSTANHRIEVGEVKILQLENIVYLKNAKKLVIIKNVDRVFLKGGYLYFRSLGRCEIIFNCRRFYRYFNLEVVSTKFDLKSMKEEALSDLTNNLFDLNKSVKTKKYINILKNILKIDITDRGITITKNLYNLPFTLTYKSRNKIKKINVL